MVSGNWSGILRIISLSTCSPQRKHMHNSRAEETTMGKKRKNLSEDEKEIASKPNESVNVVNVVALDKVARRKLKKQRKKLQAAVSEGKASKEQVLELYGDNAKVQLELKLSEYLAKQNQLNQFLKVKDIQQLLTWLLTDGVSTKWIFVKNKMLVENVAVLVVDGLDRQSLQTYPDCIPNMRILLNCDPSQPSDPIPVSIPHSYFTQHSVLTEWLTSKVSKREDRQQKDKQNSQTTPAPQKLPHRLFYVLSKEEQKKNEYPLDVTSEGYFELDAPPVSSSLSEASYSSSSSSSSSSFYSSSSSPSPTSSSLSSSSTSCTISTSSTSSSSKPAPVESEYFDEIGDSDISDGEAEQRRAHQAKQAQPAASSWPRMIGIDCEMVFTTQGFELARVSMVCEDESVLYDTLVRPTHPVTNYLTRYSGLKEEDLKDVTVSLKDVQAKFKSLLNRHDILVGHSLENDLKALKLIHGRVIDTALLYPHPRGPPNKSSLKYLARKYLNMQIQQNTEDESKGHDSIEDAVAALQLTKLKLEKGPSFGVEVMKTENVLTLISSFRKTACLIAGRDVLRQLGPPSASTVPCNTDKEVFLKTCAQLRQGGTNLLVSHFRGFHRALEESSSIPTEGQEVGVAENERNGAAVVVTSANVLQEIDGWVKAIYQAAPRRTVLMVLSGQSCATAVKRLRAYKQASIQDAGKPWTSEHDQQLKEAITRTQEGLLLLGVKNEAQQRDQGPGNGEQLDS
eukprot:g21530.t1